MERLIAFKGQQTIKHKYLERVKAHYDADEIIHGIYWESGKGCAVGCTIEGDDHAKYETELGIPRQLAYLEDTLFEGLKNGDAKEFPLRFLEAITPGADLSLVVSKLVVWQFEDDKYGLKHNKEVEADKEVYGFCEEVVALYKRKIAGETVTKGEFEELYQRIDGAGAGAWVWARAWAWAGAGAWAGARAGAWAGADYQKSYDEYIKQTADKLIELLGEAS